MRLLVLGGAISGSAAARLGRRLGHSVTVYDQSAAVGAGLIGEGIGLVTGRWDPDLLTGVDLVVTSPGVPLRAAPITDAREAGAEVVSELEFGWRHLTAPIPQSQLIAVTGTNGKTTTTEACTAMLAASGVAAAAVGNIGTPLSAVVGEPYEVLVAEVSSFQLEFTESFHPATAVLLNIAPDHLDWHPSYTAYVDAKAKVIANQVASDLLIFDADDPGVGPVTARARGRRHPVSGRSRPAGGSGPAAGALHLPGTSVPLTALASNDPALLVDLTAAAVAAHDRGARPEALAEVCRRFRPGSHRRELVAIIDDVAFVNDSKATNPHAALASVSSFGSVVLIAGGLAKGLDVAPLATAPNVTHLIAIGTSAPVLLEAAGRGRATEADSIEEAVALAARMAEAGDTVLLAPGCASFDMFTDYAARGDAFVAAVKKLTGLTPGGASSRPGGAA
ncbi:MAG TPA: UDP-N-acetylmuramoyl-L-alanine--D-glutamate ligase [Acidimicrobiia bacterium]|nr:UDP-N-acetylmuramoyl-L-alanine--D-glutamate ligase [Acidimicrobiia bacterium]